jgi:hypothetical protein
MKKLARTFLCLTIILGLVACGGGDRNAQEDETATSAETSEVALPSETQLILGTLKLDGTDLEVTADQASQLLTLWKAVQALSTSDTTAQEEMDAMMNQIHATMTDEQLDAIDAMELTQGDMASIMAELGIGPEGGSTDGEQWRFGGQEPPEGFTQGEIPEGEIPEGGFQRGERQGGEFPEGGFPGGGFQGGEGLGGQGLGQEMDPEQMATLQASRAERTGFENRAYLFLIDPLIQYLEGKVE